MPVSGEIFAPYAMVFPVGSSLGFGVFRVSPRRVFLNGVWGYQPGMSALTLLGDLETLLRDYLRQPLSDLPRSEQRDACRSKLS